MKIFQIIILSGSLFVFSVSQGRSTEYMTLQEYNSIHQQHEKIAEIFNIRVQKTAHPIDSAKDYQTIKIIFVYPGEQVSDYWRRSITSFKKRMDETGISHELYEYFSKPAVDYRVQEMQMKSALEKKPDYLVFTLDARKHKRIIQRIITKKKPKIILQNITTPLRIWEGKQPFLYIGFDHATGSELLADYYVKKTAGEGTYALLYFSEGYVSEMRGDTFIRYLNENSRLKLVASYYTDGNRQKAKEAALEIIKNHPDIKFIYACSTDVAFGAIDALQQTGSRERIMVNGWGGGSSELQALKNGDMDVTVMRMNDDNGVAMAEAVQLDIEGRAEEVPTVYSGSFVLVDKEMNSSEIEKLKEKAFRYSGQGQ